MAYLHLIIGIILFGVFLITGQFMRLDFPDKEIISQELRLLMRSRHIYILFSAFLHILLGLYFKFSGDVWRKYGQFAGSVLLFVSSCLLVWAFVEETYYSKHFSGISGLGIYLTLAGMLAHLISNFKFRKIKEREG